MAELNKEKLKENVFAPDSIFWKPKGKKSLIRLLPPSKKSKLDVPWILNVLHYGLPTDETGQGFVCLRNYHTQGAHIRGEGECPICTIYNYLYQTGIDENIALARKIKHKPNFIVNILDYTSKDDMTARTTPVQYRFGITVFGQLLEAFKKQSEEDIEGENEILNITSLTEGYSLFLTKEVKDEKKGFIDYTIVRSQKATPVKNAEAIMKVMADLTTFVLPVDKNKKEIIKNAEILKKRLGLKKEESEISNETEENDFPFDEPEEGEKEVRKPLRGAKSVSKKKKEEEETEEVSEDTSESESNVDSEDQDDNF